MQFEIFNSKLLLQWKNQIQRPVYYSQIPSDYTIYREKVDANLRDYKMVELPSQNIL